jgi:hypothetical protein
LVNLHRSAWHLAVSVVLAAALLTVPLDRTNQTADAFDGCTLADEVRATSCALKDGETVQGTLAAPTGSATYRVDAFAPDATLELRLAGKGGSTEVRVLDWRGGTLATATRADDAPDVRLSTKLPLPGTYGVRVVGDPPAEGGAFSLTANLRYASAPGSLVWPAALLTGEKPPSDERRLIRVPRGGTPTTGVAASRILAAPPAGIYADFTLVADVQFEQIVGASALTVRFRYEPEAGGGTGYVFSLDPFGATVSLDTFEEGQRRSIVGDAPLPFSPTSAGPNRLVLTADGPTIRASLDGQPLLDASDGRFTRGLIAVGAVTWSEPVAVLFDHTQVTTPPR